MNMVLNKVLVVDFELAWWSAIAEVNATQIFNDN